jgi:conjugative transfer region protein TrbK
MSDLKPFKALSRGMTIFVGVLVVTVYLRGDDNQPPPASSAVREPDHSAAALERCRSISYEQIDRLAECRKVWAEQRRHFLGKSINTPRKHARPHPDVTPSVSAKDGSRLPSGLFPTSQPTER